MSDIENENLETVDTVEQADALLEQIEAPSNGPVQDAKPQPQTMDEFELTVGGKAIKAKRDQILKWASMGYDAPNKIGSLTKDRDTWKTKYESDSTKWKELDSKYGEIDKYVRENPQFWDHVTQSYQNRNQALTDASNPLATVVNQLNETVRAMNEKITRYEQTEQQKIMAQEDQAYQSTLGEMKKQYPKVDFDTPDENGKSLEYKVLEYAQQNGINNFKTAFRDFYHDELVKMSEANAKEALLKDKTKNMKLGIVGTSNVPTAARQRKDVRAQSYDDIASDIKAELGL